MSVVTDIILITGIDDGRDGDEGPGNVDRLNDWIAAHGRATDRFAQVDHHAGGHKAMQCDVWLTAINFCDEDLLEEEFHRIKWQYPRMAHMIINSEEADTLRVIRPKGA